MCCLCVSSFSLILLPSGKQCSRVLQETSNTRESQTRRTEGCQKQLCGAAPELDMSNCSRGPPFPGNPVTCGPAETHVCMGLTHNMSASSCAGQPARLHCHVMVTSDVQGVHSTVHAHDRAWRPAKLAHDSALLPLFAAFITRAAEAHSLSGLT